MFLTFVYIIDPNGMFYKGEMNKSEKS